MDTLDTQEIRSPAGLTPRAIESIRKGGNWMMFFAILLFVYMALLLVIGVWMGNETGLGGAMIISYLIVDVVLFFPAYFLYQAANHFKNFASGGSEEILEEGLVKNAFYWTFMGVLTIIFFSIFVIALIAGGAGFLTTISGLE